MLLPKQRLVAGDLAVIEEKQGIIDRKAAM